MYPLSGQVLSVDTERKQITIRHEDIPGLMPGMTMSFPVANEELLKGREPGELVMATLEVTDAVGRLKTIERVGFKPLPTDSNAAAMAGQSAERRRRHAGRGVHRSDQPPPRDVGVARARSCC